MLSKIKKLNWGRIVTLIVVFLICLFTPLLYIELALGDIEATNDIQKTLIVLLGSRIITIITTWFVEYFKMLENPKENIYNIYISCLISYIIVFGYLLLESSKLQCPQRKDFYHSLVLKPQHQKLKEQK